MSMNKLKEFTIPEARPLPVILLADVSGSMSSNGKIDSLNAAISEMISTFSDEDDGLAQIQVAVIVFGGDTASVHEQLQPAPNIQWQPMEAWGKTPMGHAIDLARGLIEDHEIIPSRAYRPTVILVSDGAPTDDWRNALDQFLASDRASKASRFAMAIGPDAEHEMLEAYLQGESVSVFEAHQAREIRRFFRWVTMSVTSRSRSNNPNSVLLQDPTDLDDFIF